MKSILSTIYDPLKMNQTVCYAYPELGKKVKCQVVKSSFVQAVLKIIEVDGFTPPTLYKAILKGNSIGEEIYVCDSIKTGDIIDCIVVSYGDNAIFVALASN
ncbi:hypothetical protein GINT2_002102 [Glugoides intestinalis]